MSQVSENQRKSPLVAAKLNTRLSNSVKVASQEISGEPPRFKVSHPTVKSVLSHVLNFANHKFLSLLRKNSQSESALDVVSQLAQQTEMESGQEENVSTDSSIPSNDDEARKLRKKQRFQFPSFVKRNKNKT